MRELFVAYNYERGTGQVVLDLEDDVVISSYEDIVQLLDKVKCKAGTNEVALVNWIWLPSVPPEKS